MRVRTWSACVALAWGIMLLLAAAGPIGPAAAQATTRIAGTTSNTSSATNASVTDSRTISGDAIEAARTSSATTTAAIVRSRQAGAAPAAARPATPARRYVVQPGDTLSGIAAATGVPGGWPALYAANRTLIGPDPGLIRPGTALALPGRAAAARYTVQPGDTLSGIAAAAGVPGGWPALYAANRTLIGPDPDAIRAGTVLAIPSPATPEPAAHHQTPATSHPKPQPTRTPASAGSTPTARASAPPGGAVSAPASTGTAHHRRPSQAASGGGLPQWLEIVLIAAGLLIATAFLTEPVLALVRRRRVTASAPGGRDIVLADYERLVVTHSSNDGTVYVLRPPDADPRAILLAARLVLAQDRYEALAGHLGVPAHWPRE